jgi:general secretion pathway protein B
MSFILDALRKSDAERQRAATPGLTDVRYAARPARRNIWVPILVAVLAANAVFMGVQWYGRRDAAPAATVPVATPAPASAITAPAPAVPAAAVPPADIRPLAREVEAGEPPAEPDIEAEFPGPPVAAAPTAAVVSAPAPAPAPTPAAARPSRILPGNDLPTAEQLMGSGGLNTPILNLDLHVYSSKPADRFVVINSRKYKEGAQLSEGPTVESITSDGVILAMQGRRFTLSSK